MIRELHLADIQEFPKAFAAQGWDKPANLFQHYMTEQQAGNRQVFVACHKEELVGYVTVIPLAETGPYANHYPEIKDFNVLEKYQGQGYGRELLKAAEEQIKETSDRATLGVGLHRGYGSAQKLYIKSGYIPDGSGAWHENSPLEEGRRDVNSDELVLYFSKSFL